MRGIHGGKVGKIFGNGENKVGLMTRKHHIHMFLSIDAGNSNVVFAFYDEQQQRWTHEYRISSQGGFSLAKLEKEMHLYMLEHRIGHDALSAIGFSSVVPERIEPLEDFCRRFFGRSPYLIQGSSYAGLPVKTTKPDEIGTDLMCNAVAAYTRFLGPCIIVDFGTALTFTVIGPEGQIMGVNILPGLKTAMRALFTDTAKLPEVALELPSSAIGKDTVHSIQAGVLYGYTSLVKGMLQTIQEELGYRCSIVATGGLSSILHPLAGSFDLTDRFLTLEGIRLITLAQGQKK